MGKKRCQDLNGILSIVKVNRMSQSSLSLIFLGIAHSHWTSRYDHCTSSDERKEQPTAWPLFQPVK